jgi:streptogrisin D
MVAASAQASATPDPSQVATQLAGQLGSRSAGSYLDHATNKLVVTVTSTSDAKAVRAAGAVPKTVAFSGARLQQATTALESSAKVPGTAWAVDPATDQVVGWVVSTGTGDGARQHRPRPARRRHVQHEAERRRRHLRRPVPLLARLQRP